MVSNNLTDWHTDPQSQFSALEDHFGFTQKEMARALGMKLDTYQRQRNGKYKVPDVGFRCIELLLKYPKSAKKYAKGA